MFPTVSLPAPRVRSALLALLLCGCSTSPSGSLARDEAPAQAAADPSPPPAARPAPAAAREASRGDKRISLDDLYDADAKVEFSGKPVSGLVWLDDATWLWSHADPETKDKLWSRVDAKTGETREFDDAKKRVAAIAAIPGVGADQAKRAAWPPLDQLSKDRSAVWLSVLDDLFVYRLGSGAAVRLTATPEEEQVPGFSPDGRRLAYVRANDLYVADVEPARETRVTQDGGELVLNGKLDWLYQEEVYGRGNFDAKWWSPDSRALAFLRLDEKGVPPYTLVDDVPSPAVVETGPYPRAGDTNPKVALGVWREGEEAARFVDLKAYEGTDFLIVDVAWSPGGELFFQVQDREQTWLDLCVVDAAGGAPKQLLREQTRAWVEPLGSPKWLADGSFLWFSERTGWKHLYHYRADGTLVRALTEGEWEARTFHGVDEKAGLAYFSGTERSHVGSDAYSVPLSGGRPKRLTERAGTHEVSFSPGFAGFVDTWSDLWTPKQVRLHAADGRELRVVDANPVPVLQEYALVRPEFVQVPTRDGFVMDAVLYKPLGFDASRRYPVFQQTYAGPHAPQVKNSWGGVNGMFFQMLAQKGIVVWLCDNRSASGRGAVSSWHAYQRLGESELPDIEDGLAWLCAQPWVDPERVGIYGWSYGGFMVSYAMTRSKRFACGIAGGSVTDWHNYDSIYTERIMKTPANNPGGYERTSVVAKAGDLSGRILLVHGAIDDNVHPQNTMQLAHALMKAGKEFDLMLYPKTRHGITDAKLLEHSRRTMVAFLERHLLGAPQP